MWAFLYERFILLQDLCYSSICINTSFFLFNSKVGFCWPMALRRDLKQGRKYISYSISRMINIAFKWLYLWSRTLDEIFFVGLVYFGYISDYQKIWNKNVIFFVFLKKIASCWSGLSWPCEWLGRVWPLAKQATSSSSGATSALLAQPLTRSLVDKSGARDILATAIAPLPSLL